MKNKKQEINTEELPKKRKHNNRWHVRQRIRIIQILLLIFPLAFALLFAPKYLILASTDSTYKATKNNIILEEISTYATEGDYVDRNGNIIYSSGASYPESYSYAYLLGYYTTSSSQENTYGIRGSTKDYTWFTLDDNNKGATVYLTTDNDLQDYCYELLAGREGSITVIDNDTGAILALTSQSTIDYDVNDTESFTSNTTVDGQYRRGTYENDPPGSTFKVVTAAAALKKQEEEGLSDDFFDYYDTGTYTPDGDSWTITNYNNEVYYNIGLTEAMAHSVNCYFANLGVTIGAEALQEQAEAFLIGQDIEIPFLCTLHSTIDIVGESTGVLAQSAFGQGNTEITPVHLALIAQAIANGGVMMSPYIVSEISGEYTYYTAEPSELATTMTSTVNEKLKTILRETAYQYGFYDSYGNVYAKTGTAECADGSIHCYMIGFTDTCSFCVSFNDMSISTELYSEARSLVSYLNNNGF